MREGWVETTLNDIAKWGSGGTPKSTNKSYYNGDIPWLIIGDLNDGYVSFSDKSITNEGLKNSSAKIVPQGSVLIAMYGSIGKLGINTIPLATNQAIAFTKKLSNGVFNKYLFHYLLYCRPNLHKLGQGGTQKNISQTILKSFKFPLAPLPEQRAIVAKIEQLFSGLDNGIANLKTAQDKLEIYRQAVLKKAFEGELTKTWREQQSDLPSADELLEQIKHERQRHYEQQLTDWEKAVKAWEIRGKEGRKPAKPRKISSFKELLKTEHPSFNIYTDWVITKLEYISKNITDGDHQAPPKANYGIPFITISNIKNNRIDFENTFYVKNSYYSSLVSYRKPVIGDVLYTVTGSFGIPVIIDFEKEFCFQRHIGLIRPSKLTNSRWLFWLLQTRSVYLQALDTATGIAQKTVGLGSLRNFVVPICSLQEQTQIVQEIESRLSVCDKLSDTINEQLKKAEALRQSILKKAFEGRLLSDAEIEACKQEADWEPAEQLLARIKAEKVAK